MVIRYLHLSMCQTSWKGCKGNAHHIDAMCEHAHVEVIYRSCRYINSLYDAQPLTQNIHIYCDISPASYCLSMCRHHCIGGCTFVRPGLGTLYVVYPEYLLVLCQRSSHLLPCKLTGCRVWIGWSHGTCDGQWLTFDHLLLPHWSKLRFICITRTILAVMKHELIWWCWYSLYVS